MPPRLKHAVAIAAATYLGYAALVLLLVTPALNAWLPDLYRQQTGRELRSGELLVNPFTLTVILRNAGGDDADGRELWSLRELTADLSLASVWRRGLVLDRALVDGLALRIEQTAPGRYNFSDILDHRAAHFPPAPEAEEDGPLPLIAIDEFALGIDRFDYRAPFDAEPLALRLRALGLDVADFTTRPPQAEENGGDLPALASGRIAFGFERFELESLRAEEPFTTHLDQLRLALDQLTTVAAPGQPYHLEARDERGGQLRWRGTVALAGKRSEGDLLLEQISLRPLWRYLAPHLNFRVDDTLLDMNGRYSVDWGRTPLAWSVEDGHLALHDVALEARDDLPPTDAARSRVAFSHLAVDGIRLDGERRAAGIGAVQLDGLEVRSWNRDTEVGLLPMFAPRGATPQPEPAAAADAGGEPWRLQVDTLELRGARIDWHASQLDVEALALSPLDAKVEQLTWPAQSAASLSASARLNDSVSLTVSGDFNPSTLDAQLQGELAGLPLTWGNKLLTEQLTASIASGTVDSRWQLTLTEGSPAQISADGDVDAFRLLRQPNDRRLLDWKRLTWSGLAIDLNQRQLQLAEVKLTEPFALFRIGPDGTNNFQQLVKPAPPQAAQETAAAPAIDAVRIERVLVDNGILDFRDASLPRPFQAKIGQFSGSVTGLSNAPGRRAKVDFDGSVDGYAPVTLTGTAAPLAPEPDIDLALDFNNLDLATFTPYSSTYAGYAIDRGQLTVQLAYQLEGSRIRGSNRVIVNQLQLGERVQSDKAINLPLRLAIALLTDERGVMDLGVDISGDVDDPQFDLGDIVWQAFRNLIVKAATAPFRLLAGLVGSSESLGYVDFASGGDEVDDDARGKLATLKDALEKRPALRLGVAGQVDPVADGAILRQRELNRQLARAGLDAKKIAERGRPWRRAINREFQRRFPDDEIGDRTPEQLEAALQEGLELNPTALRTLATNRALAVKRVLVVELGMPADRVFIEAAADSTPVEKPRASLKVDG
jgi:uncharacterized protein involved in outer membrane biogenesis